MKTFTHILKRNGKIVRFTPIRITNAIYRAAIAAGGRNRETAEELTKDVVVYLLNRSKGSQMPGVEDIQDAIEKILIESGHAQTAKAFILYRKERNEIRKSREEIGDSSESEELIPWKKVWQSLNWAIDHRVLTIEQLNKRISEGSFPELIKESEAAYQLDILKAADSIMLHKDDIKLVIIAGPSSSGKTTTTLKIAEHLKNDKFEFIPYHIDNYFFDLKLHPKDEYGDYDYETPEAIDLELLNTHLKDILDGKEVFPPYFNFKTGKREGTSGSIKLKKGQILLIDSHHGLYAPMTEGIADTAKLKLYIEPLLQMRGNDGSFIRWTDIRLIRRIMRDTRERAILPDTTLKHWHYVRSAELRYIMPHILNADHVINSAMPYELAIWKHKASQIFKDWVETRHESLAEFPDAAARALRVYNILKDVQSWKDDSVIPEDALLREFIGK